jgi:hypothetical protein
MANFRHPWPVSFQATSAWPGGNAFFSYLEGRAPSPIWNTPLIASADTVSGAPVIRSSTGIAHSTSVPLPPAPVREQSGAQWVARYPTSTSTGDLVPAFATAVGNFIAAIQAAGGSVTISATYRPPERAYLMHYAWAIANDGAEPEKVAAMAGVNIDWAHLDARGKSDRKAAVKAASAMVRGYGMAHSAVLASRHTQKRAIDMTISGIVGKSVKDAAGVAQPIHTLRDLNAVGKSYGVIKLVSDPPHWSDDGH